MDKTDRAILALLQTNARLSWQDIGRQVHLSGQAVAVRVQQMRDAGTITGFTARLGAQQRYLVTMFMTTARFDDFEQFIRQSPQVQEACKTAGEGCYHLVVAPATENGLEDFLSSLLPFGTYRVHNVVRQVK